MSAPTKQRGRPRKIQNDATGAGNAPVPVPVSSPVRSNARPTIAEIKAGKFRPVAGSQAWAMYGDRVFTEPELLALGIHPIIALDRRQFELLQPEAAP